MTDDNVAQESKRTPEWASKPFDDFIDFIENLHRVLSLSISGISKIRAVPAAIEWLAKGDSEKSESLGERLKKAHDDAEFAQQELDAGFPLLHAQATVSLWGGLESLIRLFLVEWLRNEPDAMRVMQVQKLKIQLGDYESLSNDEKPYYILDLLERDFQFPLKQGTGRFETLLGIFGIVGTVNEDIKKNIFEMNQVRNLLVHRRGIIDRKFVVTCPWLDVRVGDLLKVSSRDFERYSNSVLDYVLELMLRVGVHFGKLREEFMEFVKNRHL